MPLKFHLFLYSYIFIVSIIKPISQFDFKELPHYMFPSSSLYFVEFRTLWVNEALSPIVVIAAAFVQAISLEKKVWTTSFATVRWNITAF